MNKTLALLSGLGLITLFGILIFVFPDRSIESFKSILTAIVGLVSAYIGLQTLNNGVKGKFFNQALYDAENGEEAKPEGGKK